MKKFKLSTLLGFLGVFLSIGPAHAGLIITDDTLYLQRAQMYPYVGWYTDLNSTTGEIGRASGVLVHPNFVLASAHQAFDSGSAGAPWSSNFRFGFGSNSLTDPGESQLVSEVFIHPTYGGVGAGGSGYDLALYYFENPFTTVTPATLFLGEVVNGMDSDIVGFGNVQMVNTTDSAYTGDRRAGNNVIDTGVLTNPVNVGTRLRNSTHWNFRELGMAIRPAYSGGGLIINGGLAGINSQGSNNSNIFGTISQYSRLDNPWISTTIASKTSVPEPGSFLLFGLGSLFALRRKRRTEEGLRRDNFS